MLIKFRDMIRTWRSLKKNLISLEIKIRSSKHKLKKFKKFRKKIMISKKEQNHRRKINKKSNQ